MKKYLLDLYISCKTQFVQAIEREIRTKQDKIVFSPNIHVELPCTKGTLFVDIIDIEYNPNEKCCYVHNYRYNDYDTVEGEYWTPLRDLTFDELYKIAERL